MPTHVIDVPVPVQRALAWVNLNILTPGLLAPSERPYWSSFSGFTRYEVTDRRLERSDLADRGTLPVGDGHFALYDVNLYHERFSMVSIELIRYVDDRTWWAVGNICYRQHWPAAGSNFVCRQPVLDFRMQQPLQLVARG